ncbi:MAG TPA: hydantoinase B/oxoprolinase family protein [Chloroflexota bacterium]|nr:hydantoinase B/oxoprolinase family protein [Chloroflexota bacterium]
MARAAEAPAVPADVAVDPVTFEVIRHRLLGITDEQAAKLRAISGSKNVTEMSDFNVGLYLPDGAVAAMGRTILFHSYSMATMVRHVMADCADNPGIGPGDMFIVNNPWKGAVHAPDMCIVAPVFAGDRLIFWSGALMHMSDIGGMRQGAMGLDSTECYQEGLQLTPIKLVEGGVLRRDLWTMILSHSRMAPAMTLDLKGLMAANFAAIEGLEKLVQRYGVDTLLAVMAGLIRLSDERMRRRLCELPNATVEAVGYLAYEPTTGTIPEVVLTLTKQDDRLIFDYSRSSPQVPNSTNCTFGGLMAGICAGLLPTIAYDIPWNQGLYHPVEVICPEGLICNARKPAAVSGNIAGAVWEVEMTATAALSKLAACSDQYLPEAQSSPAGRPGGGFRMVGVNNHGERFTAPTLDNLATGAGAYCHHDGVAAQGQHNIERTTISNVEALELDLPVLYLWRGLGRDGGGAGRHRGGLSVGGIYKPHKTAGVESGLGERWDVPDSDGIFGGYLGALPVRALVRHSNVYDLMAAGRVPAFEELAGERVPPAETHGTVHLGETDVYFAVAPAAGGWGDPLDRPPAAVQDDLDAGAVSPEAARTLYGAVLDAAGRVDAAATAARREQLRAARRQWPVQRPASAAPAADALTRVGPLGDQLAIVRDARGQHWTRCRCGQLLGRAEENWREYAARHVAAPEEIGPSLRVNPALEIRCYACPGCGRMHAVNVCRVGAPDPHDIHLAL